MRITTLATLLLSLAASAGLCRAQELGPVVITEIMYNPSGTDEGQEWVEIYNPTNAAVDLSRWSLEDDDGRTATFPNGTSLAAHAVAVIIPHRGGVLGGGTDRQSTYVNTAASFAAAWGTGIQLIMVESFWNYGGDPVPVTGTIEGLSNAPSPTNEMLRLIDRQRNIIDQVIYDDDEGGETPWPDDNDSGSIQLVRDFVGNVADNNNGAAWRLSKPGDTLGSRLAVAGALTFPGLASYGTPGQLPPVVFLDCNGNGINDAVDIVHGTATDSYPHNNIPDSCEGDCNGDGLPDLTQIALDWQQDRNANGQLDACEINGHGGSGGLGGTLDTNGDGVLDSFENKPNVYITEILYNPAGDDEGKEFVEIYNGGTMPVDISGWSLRDLEGDSTTGTIPAGTTIQSHEAIVLVAGSGPGVPADSQAQFRVAWALSPAVRTFALTPWQDRAQQATDIEEVLALVDATAQPVDVVNYENPQFLPGSLWPDDDGVSSITLRSGAWSKEANDVGSNWALSISGIDGARDSLQTGFFMDSRTTGSTASPGVVWTDAPQVPTGEAVITEIMYNPNSNPGDSTRAEWTEVFNPGGSALDLAGWYLRDEDGRTGTIPPGITLGAGQVMVLVPAAGPAANAEAEFRAAWGNVCQVVALPGWSDLESVPNIGGLSNSPDAGNELLTLRRADGYVVDTVNFDDANGWPADAAAAAPGLGTAWSIYLLPGHYNAIDNNEGVNWSASLQGVDQANLNAGTPIFNGFDVGSPGLLEGAVTTLDCASPSCVLDYNADTVVNPDDLGDFITDYFTFPPIPGPGGYAVPCTGNPPPYDAGYKTAFVPGGGQCNAPFPDNLGDFITAYFQSGGC